MSRSDPPRFPVTVTRLPVTRCEVCGRTLAHQPGQASAVLTAHYHRMHPDTLTDAANERELRLSLPGRAGGTLRVPAPLRM